MCAAGWLPVAEESLLVPDDGLGEGPEGLILGAEKRPSGKSRQMTGNIIRGGQLGRDFDLVAVAERDQPFIK